MWGCVPVTNSTWDPLRCNQLSLTRCLRGLRFRWSPRLMWGAVVPAEYWALSCLHPYVISSPLPDNTSVSLTRRLVGMFWGLAQASMFVCLSQQLDVCLSLCRYRLSHQANNIQVKKTCPSYFAIGFFASYVTSWINCLWALFSISRCGVSWLAFRCLVGCLNIYMLVYNSRCCLYNFGCFVYNLGYFAKVFVCFV